MTSSKHIQISVLKFGSSVLRTSADLPGVVHEIYAELRRGRRVVVVASALGSTTDELYSRARSLTPEPEPRALAKLLATGETAASSLLSLALERAGVNVRLISPEDISLLSEGGVLDAHPTQLDTAACERFFESAPVLVLPGFISYQADGELALLGRGGSDLTAIFVAGELARRGHPVRCVLVKDVDGLFEWDPAATAGVLPRLYSQISFGDALELSGDVVQHKAIRLARESGLRFEVGSGTSLRGDEGSERAQLPTIVGPDPSSWAAAESPRFTRLRVAIAGHGTVGAGVLEHLLAEPDDFEISAVLVRDVEKHRLLLEGQPSAANTRFEEWFTDDVERFLAAPFDVLVETVGGENPTLGWIKQTLSAGRDVVTANKAVLARHGRELQETARKAGSRLLFSASVGGGVPLLEQARSLASESVRGFEAILNGTSNYVLEAMSRGVSIEEAIVDAQDNGYAEADPTLDLDGTDAAQKVTLLARALFGESVLLRWGTIQGVNTVSPALFEEAQASGGTLRIVSSCYLEKAQGPDGPAQALVQVGPVVLPSTHPLASVLGVGAGAVFDFQQLDRPRVALSGSGAGRWPTAEAVVADLLDLRHGASRSVQDSISRT